MRTLDKLVVHAICLLIRLAAPFIGAYFALDQLINVLLPELALHFDRVHWDLLLFAMKAAREFVRISKFTFLKLSPAIHEMDMFMD